MVGRRVKSDFFRMRGTAIKWEPLGASMTDVLVREDDGRECWYGSHDLQPDDEWGPLPSRADAQERARVQTIAQLEAIRAQLIAEWHRPWPGAEFGKALIGQSIDGALKELKERK